MPANCRAALNRCLRVGAVSDRVIRHRNMLTGDNKLVSRRKVNTLVKQFSSQAGKEKALTDFGERLLFVIWLAGKKLGVDSNKDFADAIGKRSSQLSKWLTEDPRPEWTSIRAIAEPVGVDPNWLDDPSNPRAVVPDDYPEWIAARRERASQRQA